MNKAKANFIWFLVSMVISMVLAFLFGFFGVIFGLGLVGYSVYKLMFDNYEDEEEYEEMSPSDKRAYLRHLEEENKRLKDLNK